MKRKKNYAQIERLHQLPAPPKKDFPPMYTFKKNKKRNPYSQIVDNFLKRQLIIASHFSLITSIPLRDQLNFFGYFMLITDHNSKKHITPENRITIDKTNKTNQT